MPCKSCKVLAASLQVLQVALLQTTGSFLQILYTHTTELSSGGQLRQSIITLLLFIMEGPVVRELAMKISLRWCVVALIPYLH